MVSLPAPRITQAGTNFLSGQQLGRQQGFQDQDRQTMLNAGELASAGDLSGASKALFKGGQFDKGLATKNAIAKMSADRIDQALKVQDRLARLAGTIETPEQFEMAKSRLKQMGLPVPQSLTFEQLPQIRAEALTVADQLTLALKEKKMQQDALEAQRGKLKPGWQWTPEGTAVRIPGTEDASKALTPAQEAADKAFAKDYTENISGGGFADARKNITQMKEVLTDLENPEGPQLTGPFLGSTPDFVTKFTHPKAIDTRERVEEVVQRNLRQILGAQFTEAEGERLISRAYNPRLPEHVNAERLSRLVTAMEAAYDAKVAAARHYEQHGTLSNYPGSARVTVADLEEAIDGAGQTPQESQPPAPAVQFLQKNTSPEIIEQFNRKYGPGAAERVLSNQPSMTGVSP